MRKYPYAFDHSKTTDHATAKSFLKSFQHWAYWTCRAWTIHMNKDWFKRPDIVYCCTKIWPFLTVRNVDALWVLRFSVQGCIINVCLVIIILLWEQTTHLKLFSVNECDSVQQQCETQWRNSRLSNAPVVVWTLKGQASESSLYIKAALILCACVCSRHAFINIWERKDKKWKNVISKHSQK